MRAKLANKTNRRCEKDSPRKPTQPFGVIAFSKSGKVTKKMQLLSGKKSHQERQVVESFISGFNTRKPTVEISDLAPLDERDQDFSARFGESNIEIQVTELVSRTYIFEMSEAEYDSGNWDEVIQAEYGGRPKRIDTDARDNALWISIKKKVDKNYSKSDLKQLWLVVFTTESLFLTEFFEAGVARTSIALDIARAQLAQHGSGPFDRIWITNLLTRPVQIWPMPTK